MGIFERFRSVRDAGGISDAKVAGGGSVVGTLLKWGMGLFVGFLILSWMAPFAIVPTGYRGVLTTFGKPSAEVYSEGIHLRIPIVQEMHKFDVRIQKGEGQGDAASKDLQSVTTKVAINYHVDPAAVVRAYSEIGPNIDTVADRMIVPAVHESVKAVTARFTAEELITRRTDVRDEIGRLLREKMSRHGLLLDEFNIVNFSFSKSFAEAIEAKVKADQDKLKAERDLLRIKVEAEQKITSARAEAEALRLQKQEVTAELLRLREIENTRRAIEKWNGQLPQVSGGATPFIDVTRVGKP